MTTPSSMGAILKDLRARLCDAERAAKESHVVAVNSYGAGYDRGFADAIKEILDDITGNRI